MVFIGKEIENSMSNSNEPPFIRDMIKVSSDLWQKGWVEANSGNLSLRIPEKNYSDIASFKPKSDWVPLMVTVPELANDKFLISGTGRYLRNIPDSPLVNAGIVEIDQKGRNYRVIEGFENGGQPTSELSSHLKSHASIKISSDDTQFAVMHCHAPYLIALTYRLNVNSQTLSKLIWQMHTECAPNFPEGIELIPWMIPGTSEIGEVTAKALAEKPLALWQYHGVFARGRNFDEAFGVIDIAEKAAHIYLVLMASGGIGCLLSDEQIKETALNLGISLNQTILFTDTKPLFQIDHRMVCNQDG